MDTLTATKPVVAFSPPARVHDAAKPPVASFALEMATSPDPQSLVRISSIRGWGWEIFYPRVRLNRPKKVPIG